MLKSYSEERTASLVNDNGKNQYPHAKGMKMDACPTLCTQIDLQWIKDIDAPLKP